MVSYITIGLIALGIALLGATIAVIYYKWNHIQHMLGFGGWVIDCDIYEIRGGDPVYTQDVARRVYDPDGKWEKIQFLNRPEEAMAPDRDKLYQKQDGRVKVTFVRPDNNIYNPVKINHLDDDEYEMLELGMDIKNLGVQQINQAFESYANNEEGFFQKHGSWIAAGVFVICVGISVGIYVESVGAEIGNTLDQYMMQQQASSGG